jgi:nucleoside 2-deoxyribosyltransferase
MKRRLYIAAPFRAKEKVQELADFLEKHGYTLNARWLTHVYEHEGGIHNPLNLEYAVWSAQEDLEDAEAADVMIVLLRPHAGSHYGWLVELGVGLAKAAEVWLVGEKMNVFCLVQGILSNGCLVRYFETVADLRTFVRKEDMA